MADDNNWNQKIIDEFHANGGKVGGPFEGASLLLLHTIGRRSGKERVSPLMYKQRGDDYVIFASKGGAPENPDWYYNLISNPEASIEVGTKTVSVRGNEVEGDERDNLWQSWKQAYPQFAEYEKKTDREIPVIVLEPES